ncbi:MAG: DUF4369 domain-containing protein [Paludibacter sp.]|nr:DUF4369 domain-containing protein [Paludibacter sp.]
MKNIFLLLFIIAALVSCNQNDRFKVDGTVKNASGEMLYFEHTGLLKTTVLDSVKLNENGKFSFKSERPAYPDFYCLRLNNKTITFAVDSCEEISFETQAANFATDYVLIGSTTSLQIQTLRKSVMQIQQKVNNLSNNLSSDERAFQIDLIKKEIDTHKEMARKLILQNPRSAAAYFAIYQKVNNTYLFSPYDKADKPYCAAVATSYNTFMPEYDRSKNLYSLVMDAIKTERQSKDKEVWNKIMEESGKGYIDISLNDKNNINRKLSELEGKVVLIDFSAYESKESVSYTFQLRELYNKYHGRGFEIYQISLDRNKLIWEKSIANIPWVCVRDQEGPNTKYISTYNITSIPTTFLMNRKGELVARDLNYPSLIKAIETDL